MTNIIDQVYLTDLYRRQLDVLPPSALVGKSIIQIGAGGIGSPTLLILGQMGFPRAIIFDPDTVDLHNRSYQFFRKRDVGRPKVVALKEILDDFIDTDIEVFQERFQRDTFPLSGIVISAVDSMGSRKEIWEAVRGNPEVDFYVEARMGIELLRVYAFDPANEELAQRYEEKKLYPDERAFHASCTGKAIAYTTWSAGSIIANTVGKYVQGKDVAFEVIFDLRNLGIMVR